MIMIMIKIQGRGIACLPNQNTNYTKLNLCMIVFVSSCILWQTLMAIMNYKFHG